MNFFKFDWKTAFIFEKFRLVMIGFTTIIVLIFSLFSYTYVKSYMYNQVKKELTETFIGVNKQLLDPNNQSYKPITSGILKNYEMVYVMNGNQMLFKSPIPPKAKQIKNLQEIDVKQPGYISPINIRLYVDMKQRVSTYFDAISNIIIPIFALLMIGVTALAVVLLYFLTKRLNKFIYSMKYNDIVGVEFNDIIVLEGSDEAALISNEVDKLNKEVSRLLDRERQFVHNSYYNFKNPLAMMEANLGIMEKRNVSDEGKNVAREAIKTILFDTKEMLDTMIDLNNEEIIVSQKVENINLADVVNEIVEEYRKIYPDFSFKTDMSSLSTNIRKEDMAKLINVLLENAVKYSTEELKEVVVKIKSKSKKHYLIFEDFGVGMTAENAEKAFDLFWKYDNKRAISMGGVGIGLSVAKKICERYKFKIKLSTQLGIGTTVIVELE